MNGFAEQAKRMVWNNGGGLLNDIALKIVTELVVKECLRECWYDATPKQISDNIKAKFEIKE